MVECAECGGPLPPRHHKVCSPECAKTRKNRANREAYARDPSPKLASTEKWRAANPVKWRQSSRKAQRKYCRRVRA